MRNHYRPYYNKSINLSSSTGMFPMQFNDSLVRPLLKIYPLTRNSSQTTFQSQISLSISYLTSPILSCLISDNLLNPNQFAYKDITLEKHFAPRYTTNSSVIAPSWTSSNFPHAHSLWMLLVTHLAPNPNLKVLFLATCCFFFTPYLHLHTHQTNFIILCLS